MRIQRFCFSCNFPGVRLYPIFKNHAFGHNVIFSGKKVTVPPKSKFARTPMVAAPAVSPRLTCGPCTMNSIYEFVICLLCGKLSTVVILIVLQNIISHVRIFPVLKSHIAHVNHGTLKTYWSVIVSSTFLVVMRVFFFFVVLWYSEPPNAPLNHQQNKSIDIRNR